VVALIDFAINLVLLVGIMVWFGFWPQWQVAFLPAFVVLAVLARALRLAGRVFAVVPEEWRMLCSLNPLVAGIDGFRRCLPGGQSQLYVPGFVMSLGVVAFLWLGISYSRRTERTFADLLYVDRGVFQ
jgi:lipopolysaccharide transport system permease protein